MYTGAWRDVLDATYFCTWFEQYRTQGSAYLALSNPQQTVRGVPLGEDAQGAVSVDGVGERGDVHLVLELGGRVSQTVHDRELLASLRTQLEVFA